MRISYFKRDDVIECSSRFDLASLSRKPIYAAAACIVLANRRTNEFLDNETIAKAEATAGRAVLEAIASYPLDPKVRFRRVCIVYSRIDW